jgi:hypothetical protein
MAKIFFSFFILLFFLGCSSKQLHSTSATVLLKVNGLKLYDKGFITKFNDKINITVFSFGEVILNLDVYKDRVCETTFKCIDSKTFNKNYLSPTYNDDFLYQLLLQEKIDFKDKKNSIRIKVIQTKV